MGVRTHAFRFKGATGDMGEPALVTTFLEALEGCSLADGYDRAGAGTGSPAYWPSAQISRPVQVAIQVTQPVQWLSQKDKMG
jgi:hypothetical protein